MTCFKLALQVVAGASSRPIETREREERVEEERERVQVSVGKDPPTSLVAEWDDS